SKRDWSSDVCSSDLGKRTWIFHTIPQPGEFGNETWENDSWSYTGNTGVWGELSADDELGYLYFGVETPTRDNSGVDRPGDNLFRSEERRVGNECIDH